MLYKSLNKQSGAVSFKEAVVRGQAPDKGLYFPETLPQLDNNLIKNLRTLSKEEIAVQVMRPYVGNEIQEMPFITIMQETINFPMPLVQVSDNMYSLELFHGPTLAFKDVGARCMSRMLSYFNQYNKKKVTVLVATSGDTGGAVADGFKDAEGVEVIILYPSGKVSPVQELQLTTSGNNITALEVTGNFDDCQLIVKTAFADADLNDKLLLTSANSINVARWLPQQLFYFFALQQWSELTEPVFCVPSGNFGNIGAGVLAQQTGLPVKHFIAACNVNDAVPKFLQGQPYQPKNAIPTVSNAMDVGNPSNFIRIQHLYKNNFDVLKANMSSYTVSDDDTIATIKSIKDTYNYLPDPHGAVGFFALQQYVQQNKKAKGIVLETAHPVKFPDVVKLATGAQPAIPDAVQPLFSKQKQSVLMSPVYTHFKEWLMQRAD
jgi:threonine synthase